MNHALMHLMVFFGRLILPLFGVTLVVCFIPERHCPRILLGLLLVLNALSAGSLVAYSFGRPFYNELGLDDRPLACVMACLLFLLSLPVATKYFRRRAR